jgi:hypothetical protein
MPVTSSDYLTLFVKKIIEICNREGCKQSARQHGLPCVRHFTLLTIPGLPFDPFRQMSFFHKKNHPAQQDSVINLETICFLPVLKPNILSI